jgi:hypothetical protein
MTGHVFRFSSDLYPPTEEGRKELLRELKFVAKLSGGIDLILVGGVSPKKIFTNITTEPQLCCRVVCKCGVIYQNESKKLNKENGKCIVNTSVEYRKTTLHNDRLNDRTPKEDAKLSHKTSTSRRATKDAHDGFLLKIGMGNCFHQFHARAEVNRVCQVPTSLLSEQQREELRDVERSHIGKSAARNMFFARHGILLSREQIRHIASKVDMDLKSGDIDEILKRFFEKENARGCFLFEKISCYGTHSKYTR